MLIYHEYYYQQKCSVHNEGCEMHKKLASFDYSLFGNNV